jgi:cation:H+ antiporter
MLEYILFVIGLVLIIKGADYLVDGSSILATRLGISQLVIGLTIVAFGTSAPELVVALISIFEGTSEIVLGNIIGSNISNLLLILGAAAVIYPLKIRYSTIWKEIPFSLLAALLLLALVNNEASGQYLTFYDGIALLFIFAIFIYYTFMKSKEDTKKKKKEEIMEIKKENFYKSIGMIAAGLIGLFVGGKWVVDGAVAIAIQFGLSEFLISATIIAIGTSLPELAVAVSASLKRKADIAIGNIVGSNIFNILLVLGTASLISPVSVPIFVNTDIIFLIYMSVLLFVFVYTNKNKELNRWHGLIFLLFYIGYLYFLIGRG